MESLEAQVQEINAEKLGYNEKIDLSNPFREDLTDSNDSVKVQELQL